MAQITVREATLEDVPLLVRFIRGLAEYERLLDQCKVDPHQLEEHLFQSTPKAYALIALKGREPIGFALYFFTFSTFEGRPGLYLEDLFILPEHRGTGGGKRLLIELARIARRNGCARFEWAVLDWNDPAIRFYESIGARPLSDWTTYRLQGPALFALAEQSATEADHHT